MDVDQHPAFDGVPEARALHLARLEDDVAVREDHRRPPLADAAERGWYCSFAGNATYPRAADLRFAAAKVPEDRILVETDAPFLTPQVRRGERNEPANVVATAEVIAAEREVAPADFERTVEANARALFGW